ncbi:DNA-binding response regulator in two-component regulatory system with BaeS [Burkholderiales bacterium]|jgi:two-component system, OmpR family, response regulator BaeR|nr:DNA-binding response regulator in two-component regulatory system with BaeS [Burkholderiales bacterium]
MENRVPGDLSPVPEKIMSPTGSAHILVVEDEPKIAAALRDYLENSGFDTSYLERGDQVEDWLATHPVDLIVLDLMLPGLDGLELCKRLRAKTDLPIVIVTARVEEIDRLLGLELGADDYICKPFSPREVVARVKAILRRIRAVPGPGVPGIAMDEKTQRASVDDRNLDLSVVEFQLLKILVSQPGRIFTRSQLMDAMYADYRIVEARTVDSHIKKLRKKIATIVPDREVVFSVYGVGYRYEW